MVRVIRNIWKVVVRSTVSSRVLLPLLVLSAVVNRGGSSRQPHGKCTLIDAFT